MRENITIAMIFIFIFIDLWCFIQK